MLTEQRFDIILKLLEEKKSVTVTELRELLDASESTVRRDITALDKAGKLTKVFGGAVALNHKVTASQIGNTCRDASLSGWRTWTESCKRRDKPRRRRLCTERMPVLDRTGVQVDAEYIIHDKESV